jgi:bacteriocin-like protein
MKELSKEEMTSVQGGFFNLGVINSSHNTASASPVSLSLLSGNAAGFSIAGNGETLQEGEALSGNQSNVAQVVL